MTFIDITGERPTPGFIAGYSILTVYSLALGGWAIYLGRKRLHYRSFFSVRVLFPLALLILALENAALASSGRLYDELISDGIDNNNYDDYVFIKAIFVLQAFEVPILLIVIFELTYLVHKRRSVNFCGMYFDEGRRVDNTVVMSCMLRNSIRTLAFVLLVMGLMVNFNMVYNSSPIDKLAGRAGWWPLFEEDGSWDEKVHLLLSLIPTAVLALVSFYLSIMLWRYGTESAMVVHSSMLNPWFYCFFGTVALAVGQLFGEKLYPIMSNTGMLIFITTILALMTEVDKDIVATQEVACFLVQVAKKGDQIRVSRSAAPMEQQLNGDEQHSSTDQFSSEEKTMELLDRTERINNVAQRSDVVTKEKNNIQTQTTNEMGNASSDEGPNGPGVNIRITNDIELGTPSSVAPGEADEESVGHLVDHHEPQRGVDNNESAAPGEKSETPNKNESEVGLSKSLLSVTSDTETELVLIESSLADKTEANEDDEKSNDVAISGSSEVTDVVSDGKASTAGELGVNIL